jgi:1-acyl-sn-glycerol-3-phosphate acyltransferase
MKRSGYISIDRSNRRSAYESLKRTAAALRGGVSVLIFPEGTRSRDGNLAPFKAGGFVTAVESGVPIIPVIITGTWEIMSKDGLRIKPGVVSLAIKAPIETQSYTRKTRTALLDKVRENISESLTATKENKC